VFIYSMTECTIENADSLSFPKIIATMEEFEKANLRISTFSTITATQIVVGCLR